MAIDLNKSKEEKPKSKFNLSKSTETSSLGNDKNLTDLPKRKFDLSKPPQVAAKVAGNNKLTSVTPTTKRKSNKMTIFVILGILVLVALFWFFTNTGKSPNQQNAITEQPTSNDQVTPGSSPASNSEGNKNSEVADLSQTPNAPKAQPAKETAASSPSNEVQSTPKSETTVKVNIPYKKK